MPFVPLAVMLLGVPRQDLHRLLGVSSGDKILYVGDHMYADILRYSQSLVELLAFLRLHSHVYVTST